MMHGGNLELVTHHLEPRGAHLLEHVTHRSGCGYHSLWHTIHIQCDVSPRLLLVYGQHERAQYCYFRQSVHCIVLRSSAPVFYCLHNHCNNQCHHYLNIPRKYRTAIILTVYWWLNKWRWSPQGVCVSGEGLWVLTIKVRPHRTRSAAADCGLCPLRNVTF